MTRFERWTVWSSAGATALTGLGFLWTKYFTTPAVAWAVVNHPLEPWFLKTHIVAAPVFLFAIGLILTRHVLPHLRNGARPGRRSGLIMVWSLIPMTLTGYLVQVVSSPALLPLLAALHIVTGGVFALGLAGHGLAVLARSSWFGWSLSRALKERPGAEPSTDWAPAERAVRERLAGR